MRVVKLLCPRLNRNLKMGHQRWDIILDYLFFKVLCIQDDADIASCECATIIYRHVNVLLHLKSETFDTNE